MRYRVHKIISIFHGWGSVHYLNDFKELYVMCQKDHRGFTLVELVTHGRVILHKKATSDVPETVMSLIRFASRNWEPK